MEKLSPEIIREILYHFDSKVHIANFRLVQRSLAELAKEFLFRTVPLKPTKLSISRLLAISQRPDLARHVRGVIFGIDEPHYMIWEQFNEQLRMEGLSHDDEMQGTRAQEIFKSSIQGWYEFQTSPEYTTFISAAFAGFPRLETIQMVHGGPMAMERQYTYQKIDLYPFEPTPEFHGGYGSEKDYLRGFAALINAAYLAGSKLTSFRMTGMNTEEIVDQSVFENTELLQRAAVVFRNCRVLEIHLGIDSSEVVDKFKVNPLLNVLAPAEHLEELCLGFGNTAPSGPHLFPHIFGEEKVWPRLRKLELWTTDMHENELIAFLERHKTTLKSILISNGLLFTGCWNNIMRFMKEHLQLESLEVWDLFCKHSDGEIYCNYSHSESQMMVQYVQNGGETLPERHVDV